MTWWPILVDYRSTATATRAWTTAQSIWSRGAKSELIGGDDHNDCSGDNKIWNADGILSPGVDLNSHLRTAHPQNVTGQAATIAALFMGSRKSSPSPTSFNGNILFLMLITIIVLLPLLFLTNWSYLLCNIAPFIMSNKIIFIIFFVISKGILFFIFLFNPRYCGPGPDHCACAGWVGCWCGPVLSVLMIMSIFFGIWGPLIEDVCRFQEWCR